MCYDKIRTCVLTGAGASQFAKEQGLEIVPPDHIFIPKSRFNELQEILKREKNGTVDVVLLIKTETLLPVPQQEA